MPYFLVVTEKTYKIWFLDLLVAIADKGVAAKMAAARFCQSTVSPLFQW